MIVSACVRFHTHEIECNGFVLRPRMMYDIPCHRHGDAFYIISQFLKPEELDKEKTEQGFLTHDGTFLNRYDAMDEAIRCMQLPPCAKAECAELYSEDLW